MKLEPDRYEYYKKTLSDCLQVATTLVRNYLSMLGAQTPQLITLTNQLWELSQRQRLVARTAAVALLSACHAAFQPINHFIQNLHAKLAEIADHVADFEREFLALEGEPFQLESYADWHAWLFQTLDVLQTQTKYLELHARSLAPSLVQSSTVKQFREVLQLVKQYESNFCMGLARSIIL
ncbi:uncharacterized protein LOC117794130 isoform X2 [Drosophila innubila]|uniref:uncharacterized protein LOC117794130 isoform X2 n=1 Tax=Drosophila innubila TaxID=198719 RepID=UPI00148BF15F|nr:uncharacterized protein LOC117794130 isoform X2 [Drosophila innubila]